MVSFDSETIYNAWRNLNSLDAKVGGMFCILSCIDEEIIPNKSYRIDGVKLRQKLSYVFDKDVETIFSTQQNNYIIFARNWYTTFFNNEIKNKIDLLSCAVFFLRRNNFSDGEESQGIISRFLDDYHLFKYKDVWFSNNSNLSIQYANNGSEINQKEFYSHLSTGSFYSLTFNSTLQKHAYDLSAAGHIQTLYSAKGILKTCIFSNEPLDSYYVMQNMEPKNNQANLQSDKISQSSSSSSPSPHTYPKQIIFYGVPGCGKSHKISQMLKDSAQFKIEAEEHQVVRTVFHPDYTNSDFVGQILPKINDDKTIEYSFVPGPFTKILANAYKYSQNQYVLIIEEINRGNAAAIFGETFQLLDRIKTGKTIKEKVGDNALNTYGEGWSEYFFMNDDINNYILAECNGNDTSETASVNGIAFSVNTGIRLPPNLSILATMNTSDQNVFTLDNAFQRRWDMKYIPNKIDYAAATPEQKNQYDSTIGATGIKWGVFRDKINEKISGGEFSFSNAEDKQLGLFFIQSGVDIKEKAGVIKEEDFANKVLKYLWNDIFKRDHEEIFAEGINTFGDLLSKFKGEDAFKNTFRIDF